MSIDWSKAPEGATHFGPKIGAYSEAWFKPCMGKWTVYLCDKWLDCDPSGDRMAMFVERPKTAWSGEGLPPVGTVCECMLVGGSDDWVRCEIIAHKENQAVCWVDCNRITASIGPRIRPARTPEQIAAEERSRAADEMYNMPGSLVSYTAALALYDAGYRKQVTP